MTATMAQRAMAEPGRPGGECDERVLRGGSWYYGTKNLRTADRYGYTSGIRNSLFGFRVARTL